MALTVNTNTFTGGANLTPNDSAGVPDLAQILLGLVADNAALRATITNLAAKLDADAGVSDTDYGTIAAGDLGDQNVTEG